MEPVPCPSPGPGHWACPWGWNEPQPGCGLQVGPAWWGPWPDGSVLQGAGQGLMVLGFEMKSWAMGEVGETPGCLGKDSEVH